MGSSLCCIFCVFPVRFWPEFITRPARGEIDSTGPVERQDRFKCPASLLRWCKAEDQNLGVTRLRTMEINTETADFFATHLVMGIDETKKILGLGSGEEWSIEEFGDPIHLMRVGQVKGDLYIFVGVFNQDNAVIVDIGALPFAFEENNAAFLNFCRAKMCFLEERDEVFKREWFCQPLPLFVRRSCDKRTTGEEHDGANNSEACISFHLVMNRATAVPGLV